MFFPFREDTICMIRSTSGLRPVFTMIVFPPSAVNVCSWGSMIQVSEPSTFACFALSDLITSIWPTPISPITGSFDEFTTSIEATGSCGAGAGGTGTGSIIGSCHIQHIAKNKIFITHSWTPQDSWVHRETDRQSLEIIPERSPQTRRPESGSHCTSQPLLPDSLRARPQSWNPPCQQPAAS